MANESDAYILLSDKLTDIKLNNERVLAMVGNISADFFGKYGFDKSTDIYLLANIRQYKIYGDIAFDYLDRISEQLNEVSLNIENYLKGGVPTAAGKENT